jgi:hypothetical protein
VAAVLILALFATAILQLGQWDGLHCQTAWWQWLSETPMRLYFGALALFIGWLAVHFGVRRPAAPLVKKNDAPSAPIDRCRPGCRVRTGPSSRLAPSGSNNDRTAGVYWQPLLSIVITEVET